MARVALITGGTRGIGAEISRGMQADGYDVVAGFHLNVQRAERFHEETGIDIMQFDVSDYGACEQAVHKLEEGHGPVDILINNAGITHDVFLHRMPEEAWHEVIETNLTLLLQHVPRRYRQDARPRVRAHRQCVVRQRPDGTDRPDQLRRRQGRHSRLHEGAGAGETRPRASP